MAQEFTFTVNGVERTTTENKPLLRYLRDTLHLTSVKDGCSEGACGACTVLIDGEPIRACTPFTDSLAGRHIITVEGLTEFTTASLEESLRARIVDEMGVKPRLAFGPLRVAVTGRQVSPPLFESMEILGRDSSLTRLRALRASLA